ncbi:MAG TPA: sulfite exporter TauE/SafE family protein [Leptolyngbyaceae cyanobacterium]
MIPVIYGLAIANVLTNFPTGITEVKLLTLLVVFTATSAISMVTGSTSLVTVPALMQAGIAAPVAIATNMFALTFLSLGGTLPFLGQGQIDRTRIPLLLGLTLVGSLVGALLVAALPATTLPTLISLSMLGVIGFSLATGNRGVEPVSHSPSQTLEVAGYLATFVLGIYGGFFSGGYVTLLMAVYVACFGQTFVAAIATSKVTNLVSSLVATLVFAWQGLVNYPLGLVLGGGMALGAFCGGHLVLKIGNRWVRRVFLATVALLALKMLLAL